MGVFIPSDPQNHLKTQAELKSWELDQENKQRLEEMETRRFIITTEKKVVELAEELQKKPFQYRKQRRRKILNRSSAKLSICVSPN